VLLIMISKVRSVTSAVVGLSQELFLVRDDLREWVRIQHSVLLLVRKTGSGLGKQRDHVIEAGQAIGRGTLHRCRDKACFVGAVVVIADDLPGIVDGLGYRVSTGALRRIN
jgi:hypothetical protein